MPKLRKYVEIGFCAGYGDGDFRVSTSVTDLSRKEMRELKATFIDAANCMDAMWKRAQGEPAASANPNRTLKGGDA